MLTGHEIVSIARRATRPAAKPFAGIVVAGLRTDAEVVILDGYFDAAAFGTHRRSPSRCGTLSLRNAPRALAT